MIDRVAALRRRHDAAPVTIPAGGVHTDGNGAVGHQKSHHGSLVAFAGIFPALDLGNDAAGFELASAGVATAAGVRVRSPGVQAASLDDVFISSGRIAAIAAIVGGVARGDLLDGQGGQFVALERPLGFDVFGGGEGTAAAALALIVDRRDDGGAVVSPIVGARGGGDAAQAVGAVLDVAGWLGWRLVAQEAGELFAGEVGELGDAELHVGTSRHSQVLLMGSQGVFAEDGEAVVLFVGVRVVFVVQHLEVREVLSCAGEAFRPTEGRDG